MKLNLDPNQVYQLDAIKAVVVVFEGQPLNNEHVSFNSEHFEGGVLFNEISI